MLGMVKTRLLEEDGDGGRLGRVFAFHGRSLSLCDMQYVCFLVVDIVAINCVWVVRCRRAKLKITSSLTLLCLAGFKFARVVRGTSKIDLAN